MKISDSIARVMTQRRALVWLGVFALAAICIGILITRMELDTDVTNMLPKGFESVVVFRRAHSRPIANA